MSPSFCKNHSLPHAFTRNRKLPFPIVFLIILQKSIKSLQLVVNEFFMALNNVFQTATNSAYCQARHKLLHTAFIDLSETLVTHFYRDTEYQTYKGHRLLGVDGSKVILPHEDEIGGHFGWTKLSNSFQDDGTYASGLASVCYDVLNQVALDSVLAPAKSSERKLLYTHLDALNAGDILVFDRGYTSYLLLATLRKHNLHFIGRCQRNSFKDARELFTKDIPSKTVTIQFSSKVRRPKELADLPQSITVRFVRIVLPTGEVEVLVTSLLDEERYPNADFYELYHRRWGVETFFSILKTRLQLENFTGKSVNAVLQDFYATVFITNLETLLTSRPQQELTHRTQTTKHAQKINKAVSFNALKNNVIELFLSHEDEHVIVIKLHALFVKNPTLVRAGRSSPRKITPTVALMNYLKRKRKAIY